MATSQPTPTASSSNELGPVHSPSQKHPEQQDKSNAAEEQLSLDRDAPQLTIAVAKEVVDYLEILLKTSRRHAPIEVRLREQYFETVNVKRRDLRFNAIGQEGQKGDDWYFAEQVRHSDRSEQKSLSSSRDAVRAMLLELESQVHRISIHEKSAGVREAWLKIGARVIRVLMRQR